MCRCQRNNSPNVMLLYYYFFVVVQQCSRASSVVIACRLVGCLHPLPKNPCNFPRLELNQEGAPLKLTSSHTCTRKRLVDGCVFLQNPLSERYLVEQKCSYMKLLTKRFLFRPWLLERWKLLLSFSSFLFHCFKHHEVSSRAVVIFNRR